MSKIIMMLLVVLLTVNADVQDYKHHRQLRKGKSTSSYRPSYSKTTTTTKKVAGSGGVAFYGGRSYSVLYSYYLPPNYYQAGGYFSPLYKIKYYNGYGWNFYYQQGNYYADSPNATKPSSSGLSVSDMDFDVLKAVAVMSVVAVQWLWSRM